MNVKNEKIHFESVEELLGAPVISEGTQEIKLEKIFPFKNHPFKVVDDEKMEELVESIKVNGVITPVLVRTLTDTGYEMISGHRRLHASKLAGLETIPCIVKEMTDDEAVIAMVDGNVQREEILPSERAWAFKMKMDAMRRQGYRSDITLGSDCPRLMTVDKIGQENGLKGRQVKNYIRLTNLIPEILEYVDENKIGLMAGVEISYFDKTIQHWIYTYRKENGSLMNEQIAALKKYPMPEKLTQYEMIQILNEALPKPKEKLGVKLSENQLNKYFPTHFSQRQREQVIVELLEKWAAEKENKE